MKLQKLEPHAGRLKIAQLGDSYGLGISDGCAGCDGRNRIAIGNISCKRVILRRSWRTEDSPLQVWGYECFRAEETPSSMSQLEEAGIAWLAKPSGSVVGFAPEVQATYLPIWVFVQPVWSAPIVTPIVSTPLQKEIPTSSPLTFQARNGNTSFQEYVERFITRMHAPSPPPAVER